MNTMPELKPCPFCDGNAGFAEDGLQGYARCNSCGIRTDGYYIYKFPDWKQWAANDWNARAEVYINHPVTEEPLDKSQCKRVITQMAAEIKYLKEQLGIVHRAAKTLTQMSIVEGTHDNEGEK